MLGAWIEIWLIASRLKPLLCRSLCWERGLKLSLLTAPRSTRKSLPLLGAWIEIQSMVSTRNYDTSLPLLGAWIEIIFNTQEAPMKTCRSLCWERGLKFCERKRSARSALSLPLLGAWIEIISRASETARSRRRSLCWERGLKFYLGKAAVPQYMSLPLLGAWIEIGLGTKHWFWICKSLPLLGAWIEISKHLGSSATCDVAPFAGSVD